ncbi:MAG: phosphopantetheine-binding protein, partial [Candidatus Binatia bacterium]
LQHPAVKEAAVSAREEVENLKSESSPEPGRSQRGPKLPVAYVVPRQDDVSAHELRRFVKAKLPAYMVPSAVVFLDRLPLTPNGKIDRKLLPAPDQRRPELEENYVVPRTPVEAVIAGIWAEVLKLPRVGAQDNFFDLGGHSLLATQLVSRVRERLRVELPLRVFFENPTVASLADHIETLQSIKRQDQQAIKELSGEREEIRM